MGMAAPRLPLSVEKKKKHAPAADPPFLPGVRDVIKWAFFHAGCVAFSVLIVTSIPASSWLLPSTGPEPEMTDATATVALVFGVLWCVCLVSQTAAGTLALALPRRNRLLLTYEALVATTAGHCMWAGLYIVMSIATPSGGFTFWDVFMSVVFFVCGVGDLLCFRGLILRVGEE